jgi:lysophospholipase L1-like esterase
LIVSTLVVSTLGDSITEGTPGETTWQHWAALKHPELEFRVHGVNRQRTEQIAARLDEAATGADILIVQGGINDIAQGHSVEGAAHNLREMVRRGKSLGLRVVLVDLLPWNNGWPDAEPKIRRLNELIAKIASDEDVPVLPFHDTLEDPDNPGRMKPEWTFEGDHPSVDGYRMLGERAFVLP